MRRPHQYTHLLGRLLNCKDTALSAQGRWLDHRAEQVCHLTMLQHRSVQGRAAARVRRNWMLCWRRRHHWRLQQHHHLYVLLEFFYLCHGAVHPHIVLFHRLHVTYAFQALVFSERGDLLG